MKNMMRRALSMLVCVAMLISCIPAFAEEDIVQVLQIVQEEIAEEAEISEAEETPDDLTEVFFEEIIEEEPVVEETPAEEEDSEEEGEVSLAVLPAALTGEEQPGAASKAAAVQGPITMGLKEVVSVARALEGVTYSSKDKSVASVDAEGNVTAKKVGSTTISIKAEGVETEKIKVVVKKAPKTIAFKSLPAVLGVGEQLVPAYKYSSGAASYKNELASDNAGVVAVENGALVAKAAGTANITVSTYKEGVTATAAIEVKAAPTKLTMDAAKTLGKGDKFTLVPVLAENEASSIITFESSDEKVATVSAKGVVKAVAAGEAKITAKTYLETVYAECTVKVVTAPKSVKLTAERKTIGVGEKIQLTATLSPADAESTLKFTSSKKGVAVVEWDEEEKSYVIKAKAKGETTITVKTHNGKSKSVKITVKAAPKKVEIVADRFELGVGEELTLNHKFDKNKAGTVEYTNGNPAAVEIKTVDGETKLIAKAVGDAKIYATAHNSTPEKPVQDEKTFTVKAAPTAITLSETAKTIAKGDKFTLEAKLPEGQAGKITFASSDAKVAAVNAETGKVTAKKAGSVKITATAYNGVEAVCELTVTAPPSKVKVSAARKTIGVYEEIQLTTSLTPAAAVTTLKFSSSNKKVATVSENGVVKALKKGTATITVKTHNGKKATIKFTVKKDPKTVEIYADRYELGVGENLVLNHKFDKDKAGSVTYTTSNAAIADVQQIDGKWTIVPVAPGKVTITATAHNSTAEKPVVDTQDFDIRKAPTKVIVEAAKTLGKGDKWTLKAELASGEAGKIEFTSDNKKVATVDKNGVIKAVKKGTAKITAKSYAGEAAVCEITVVGAPTSVSVSAEKKTIMQGESLQLNASWKPATAATTLKYSSSNAKVATVDQTGKVIGVAKGKATITVKTHNGKKKTITINVKKSNLAFETIENADGSLTIKQLVAPYAGVVTIPATLNGKDVTAIAANAFANDAAMTGVVIPNTVKTIGENAFAGASVLTEVTLGSGVQEIGAGAFKGCAVLSKINLDAAAVKRIGSGAFEGCAALTEVTLPAGVTAIGDRAFAECDALKQVVVPASASELGSGIFAGSEKVSLLVPAGSPAEEYAKNNGISYGDVAASQPVVDSISVTAWAYEAGETASWTVQASGGKGGYKYQYQIFKNGAAYKDASAWTAEASFSFKFTEAGSYTLRVQVKDSADKVSVAAVSDAMNISGASASEGLTYADLSANTVIITGISEPVAEIVIPETIDEKIVVAIADSAFSGRTGITKVTLPDSITEIGDKAFFGCEKLAEINMPAALTAIGENAFEGCSALKAITLPEGLKTIGAGAFIKCSALAAISVPDSVVSLGDNAFASCASLASAKLPAGLTTIYDSMFKGCAKLSSITIPAKVTEIKASAFSGCAALTAVSIPASVKTIGEGAFNGCSALKTLTLNEGLEEIAADAFNGCAALTSVKLPSTLVYLRGKAFYGCKALTSVELSAKLEKINVWTFYGCSALKSIAIPASVTAIADNAFSDCSSLASVTFASGSKLTSLGMSAFYNCAALTGITLPDSVTTIGAKAFEGCAKIASFKLPAGLTAISDYMFAGCASLKSIDVIKGIKSIGAKAFEGCTALTEVTLPNTLTSIDTHAFRNCAGIAMMYLPGSITTFGDEVFAGTSSELLLGVIDGSAAYRYALDNGHRYHVDSEGTLQYQNLTYTANSGSGIAVIRNYAGSEKSVNVPEKIDGYVVSEIGEGAFAGNASVASIDLPDSVTVIGARAFANCTSLVSMV